MHMCSTSLEQMSYMAPAVAANVMHMQIAQAMSSTGPCPDGLGRNEGGTVCMACADGWEAIDSKCVRSS
jgi:hypothetical protein